MVGSRHGRVQWPPVRKALHHPQKIPKARLPKHPTLLAKCTLRRADVPIVSVAPSTILDPNDVSAVLRLHDIVVVERADVSSERVATFMLRGYVWISIKIEERL